MQLLERIACFMIFGLPGISIIVYNYYRIFSKKATASPAYILGGVLGAMGILALLGDQWKSRWYLAMIPVVLDLGLFIISFLYAFFAKPKELKEIDFKNN